MLRFFNALVDLKGAANLIPGRPPTQGARSRAGAPALGSWPPRGALALLAAVGVAACGKAPAADACRWPPFAETNGWASVEAGPFRFQVPSRLARQPADGAREYVGVWSDGRRALAFHYGPGAADPRGRDTGGEERWSCLTRLGTDSVVVRVGVRIVRARSGEPQRQAVAEVWWPRVGADSTGMLLVGWGPEADSSVVAAEALTAARTVRFVSARPAGDSARQPR